MKTLSIAFCFLLFLCLTACGGDSVEDCQNFSIASQTSEELKEFQDAATAYGLDPTSSNCNNYKSKGTDYINSIRDLEDCADGAGQLTQFNQALDAAILSINSIAC